MYKRLIVKNGKQSYVCLQSHVVLCQLEWVRSGRWSPSVGLLTCRACRQWVDMSGWSEGSEDKGEVCVRCERVGGVGWGPQESGHPISHVELGGIEKPQLCSICHQ